MWLWLWTGWSPSIFSWFGTIWLFSVPQHEKPLDWEAVSDWYWGHICSWGLFGGSDESFYTQESKHSNTDGRSVWTTGQTMLTNKPQLFEFNHCILDYELFCPPHILLCYHAFSSIYLSLSSIPMFSIWVFFFFLCLLIYVSTFCLLCRAYKEERRTPHDVLYYVKVRNRAVLIRLTKPKPTVFSQNRF